MRLRGIPPEDGVISVLTASGSSIIGYPQGPVGNAVDDVQIVNGGTQMQFYSLGLEVGDPIDFPDIDGGTP